MKDVKRIALVVTAVGLSSLAASAGVEFHYEGAEGPSNWAKLAPEYATCGSGKNQSPVNLSGLVEGELPAIKLSQPSFGESIVNNGHTVQVNYAGGSTLLEGDRSFSLKQFHFHAPSEHQLDGKSFPMEIHFVHADADGNLAVVGVMVAEGAANPTLAQLWKAIPGKIGDKVALAAKVGAAELLPKSHDYYRYNGSLTTPPCSEGVRWYLLKGHITASAEQVAAFHKTLGFNNNRPVQPVNARVLVK